MDARAGNWKITVVDTLLSILLTVAVQFTALVLMMSSPLTLLIALSGKVPYYESYSLHTGGKLIFSLPTIFTVLVIAAYITIGGGPWWVLAAFIAVCGIIALAYFYTPQSVRNLLGRYVVLREDVERHDRR